MTQKSRIFYKRHKQWDDLIKFIAQILLDRLPTKLDISGWKFHAVDHSAGQCFYPDKIITIPTWVIFRQEPESARVGFLEYYIAHELAHAFAGYHAKHGPIFMAYFKRICPKEFQHFELEYRPNNAKAAGIRK